MSEVSPALAPKGSTRALAVAFLASASALAYVFYSFPPMTEYALIFLFSALLHHVAALGFVLT
jgi:hypothetical protein